MTAEFSHVIQLAVLQLCFITFPQNILPIKKIRTGYPQVTPTLTLSLHTTQAKLHYRAGATSRLSGLLALGCHNICRTGVFTDGLILSLSTSEPQSERISLKILLLYYITVNKSKKNPKNITNNVFLTFVFIVLCVVHTKMPEKKQRCVCKYTVH